MSPSIPHNRGTHAIISLQTALFHPLETIKYLWHREAELGGNGGYPLEVTPGEDENVIANLWEKERFYIVSI